MKKIVALPVALRAEEIDQIITNLKSLKAGYSGFLSGLDSLESFLNANTTHLQKPEASNLLQSIAGGMGIDPQIKDDSIQLFILIQDSISVQKALIMLSRPSLPTDQRPLAYLDVLAKSETECAAEEIAMPYGKCSKLATDLLNPGQTWAEKKTAVESAIKTARQKQLNTRLQEMVRGMITGKFCSEGMLSFIPDQADFSPSQSDLIKTVGVELDASKSFSEIQMYWHTVAIVFGMTPTLDFWKTIVSKGPSGQKLDETIDQIHPPVQEALKSYLEHIRTQASQQTGDWVQVERRLGDIAVYLCSQHSNPLYPLKMDAVIQLLQNDLSERRSDCNVGGLKLLNTLGQIKLFFNGEGTSLEHDLATSAIEMLQAGIRSIGSHQVGADENVHNVYYLLNKMATQMGGEGLLQDSYRAANAEDIDRHFDVIQRKANDLLPLFLSYFDAHPTEGFDSLSSYVRCSEVTVPEDKRDAVLIALMKSTQEIPDWMRGLGNSIEKLDAKKMLFLAAKSGRVDLFKLLLQQVQTQGEWDHRTKDGYGYTLTECVVLGGNVDMLRLLGSSKRIPDSAANLSLLGLAAESGSALMIEMISVEWPHRLSEWLPKCDQEGYTPYHRAIMSGNLEAVRMLDTLHTSGDQEVLLKNNQTGQTVYCLAADNLDSEGFKFVLDSRYSQEVANQAPQNGLPLLHHLMILGQIEKLEAFLEKGPILLTRDQNNQLAGFYTSKLDMVVRLCRYAVTQPDYLLFFEQSVSYQGEQLIIHRLANYKNDALKDILHGLPSQQIMDILSVASSDDYNEYTTAHFLAEFNAPLLIGILANLPEDDAFTILRLNSSEGTVAHILAKFNGPDLQLILENWPQEKVGEVLKIRDHHERSVAIVLMRASTHHLQLILHTLPPDTLFEILNLPLNNDNRTTLIASLINKGDCSFEVLCKSLDDERILSLLQLEYSTGVEIPMEELPSVAGLMCPKEAGYLLTLLSRLDSEKALTLLELNGKYESNLASELHKYYPAETYRHIKSKKLEDDIMISERIL